MPRGLYCRLPATMTVEERFWAKVDKNGPLPVRRPDLGPCWLWRAYVRPSGYGEFNPGGGMMLAHRHAYVLLVGPIPEGLTLDHLCRTRACVNPGHTEPVTTGENVRRGDGFVGRQVRRTACPKGHPYDLVISGSRRCRRCKNETFRRWSQARRHTPRRAA